MGVLPEYRNSGIGRRLKLHQRDYALANEIGLIEWTFDPLEIKNAFFNIERLGAIVRRYVHNQYGRTSSHLHGDLPTDRLVAEWWVNAPGVVARCDERIFLSPEPEACISVPVDIERLRQTNSREAADIQASIAEQFEKYFAAGLAVVGFEKNEAAGTYLLARWEQICE